MSVPVSEDFPQYQISSNTTLSPILTKGVNIKPKQRDFETPRLTLELIRAVHDNPGLLHKEPSLEKTFEAAPWLLPTRYPGFYYARMSNRDLAEVAALRSKPKGKYERTITVAFFSRGMIRMLQNCSKFQILLAWMVEGWVAV